MRKSKGKKIISYAVMVASWGSALYVGGWLMFIKPIIEICTAIDSGTLTSMIVVPGILKCIFACSVGLAIAYIGTIVGCLIMKQGEDDRTDT